MTAITLAIADWHASKACAAYLSGDPVEFCRHILICDALRRKAGAR
ncbi:MAG: hypothetical protein WBA88_19820 [Pseudaminobacter sp.]